MQELLRDYLGELRSKRRKRRRISVAVTLLIVMVAGGVIGALVQYGVAMTGDAKCGIEEHTHSDECYENVLACGQEESEGHTHTDACYQTNSTLACGLEESEEHVHREECYVNEQVLICGQEEGEGHTHTDSCYDKQLACGKEEHIHTDACYIDTTADVEESSDWDAQYKDTEWKDAWGEDLVTAAKVQVGYKESTKNYTVAADKSHKGYTRYGQFAGDVYADWDAMFVNFCMHYAGLEDSNLFPNEKTAVEWYNKFVQVSETNLSYITAPEGYEPKVGDLIFFNKEEENEFRMGVVSSYNKEKNEIKVIEGNSENEVKENEYDTDDEYIYAYLKITELETAYKDKGEEDSSAEETEQPADGEEQDPQDEITEEEGDPQDEITEEEEELQDEKTEEEEWAYEESYDADKVIVHVKAKEGVIPEGAELSVTPIEKKEITDDMSKKEKKEAEKVNEQYEMTNEKLSEESEKNEQKLEGFLAYDICFLVDGEEVEPDGEVKVAMDFKEAVVPEEVSKDATVAVNHLKKDGDGEVKVENLTEADTTTIQVIEKDASVEKIELVTESFSIFTIVWNINGMTFGSFEVKHVDENGNILLQHNTAEEFIKKIELDSNNLDKEYQLKEEIGWRSISLLNQNNENVIYEPMKLELVQNSRKIEVETIKFENGEWCFALDGKEVARVNLFSESEQGVVSYLQVVYQQEDIAELEIINNIKMTGNLDVELLGSALDEFTTADGKNKDSDGNNDQEIRYVWYKRINSNKKEDYRKVENITFDDDTSKISGEYGCSLNVALDEGALNEERFSVEYKVELYIGDKLIGTSGSESISYYSELQNGSFEEPVITDTWTDKPQEEVLGWNTTATNPKTNSRDIEIARIYKPAIYEGDKLVGYADKYTIASLYQDQNEEFKTADSGLQFAELNAESVGSLYQDVLTVKGRQLNYHLAHRARCTDNSANNRDTMYLVIVPTFIAERGIEGDGDEIDTQKEVEELIRRRNELDDNGELRFPGVYFQEYEAVTQKWSEHDGIYIPQYNLNRFFFVSAQERSTMGNFLDDVWFSQNLPKPKEDTFNFRIVKTIKGLDELSNIVDSDERINALKNKIKSLQFKIDVTEIVKNSIREYIPEILKASDMEWTDNGDGSYTGICNYYNVPINIEKYAISVEEQNTDIEHYSLLNSTVTRVSSGVWGTTQPGQSGEVEVQKNSRERLIFENTYGPEDNFIWKVVKRSSSIKTQKLEGAKFTLTDKDTRLTKLLTGETDGDGVIQWEENGNVADLSKLNGEYILKETRAPEGYSCSEKEWTLVFNNGKLNADLLEEQIKSDGKFIVLKSENNVHEISIYNDLIYALPSTGGSGVYWYMFSGILLMAGAALITYKKRCREVLRS